MRKEEGVKIIGVMLTWNNLEFFKRSVHQALDFCDELIVIEGCHSTKHPKHSTDGTCEYIKTIRKLPKLVIRDFDFNGRYDNVQRQIRQNFPKESAFYKLGNWVFQWDDDCFYMEEDLLILRAAIERTKSDALSYINRNFIYNFRFNSIERGLIVSYRIVEGLYLTGVLNPHYGDGRRIPCQHIEGVTRFHYSYVKKPERVKARVMMSIEKGTRASVGKYEQWMGVEWEKDEDIFKSRAIIEGIRPGEGLLIYKGKHPEAVADHPWRHIKDVRKVK